MNCPKCNADMELVKYSGIEIDKCTNCQGLWFDMLEKEDLLRINGSETIDTGAPEIGKQLNAKVNVNCPKCNTKMIKMADTAKHHIWFESCQDCGGIFLDAGEFKDLKEQNLFDFLKNLIIIE